jgi:hypothetical protein
VLYKFLTSRTLSTGDPEQIPVYAKPVGVVTHVVEQGIEKAVGKTVEVIDLVTHPHRKPSEVVPQPTAAGSTAEPVTRTDRHG